MNFLRRRACAVVIAAVCGICGCDLFNPPGGPSAPFDTRVALQTVAEGLTSPVALVAPNDATGRLFVADQVGLIRVIDAAAGLLAAPLLDLSGEMVALSPFYDERGLLGLALHPDFALNGRFYVYYSAPKSVATPADFDHESHLSEFTISAADPNLADAAGERILLRIAEPQGNHNGGQLAFGPDGYLYVGVGDGGAANDSGTGHADATGNAQDLTTPLGKILRIDVDGGDPYGVPADNPFVGHATALPEIWAFGFRNPWRFAFDSVGGRLFVGDVGQNRVEEVSIVERGGNYGWRLREGSDCFDPTDPDNPPAQCDDAGGTLIDPIMEYLHVAADGSDVGISVIGGVVYRGAAIPGLSGVYVFGDFSAGFITPAGALFAGVQDAAGNWTRHELVISTTVDGRLDRYLLGFGQDPGGELLVLTTGNLGPAGSTGRVDRIVRAD